MATIANPPPGFDFPLYAEYSSSAFNNFLDQADDGSADAGSGVSDARDMAYNDPTFSHLFASEAEQQQHSQAATSNAVYQSSLHPPIPNPFGQLIGAVSSSSETVNSIQSSSSSNTGSPGIHGFAAVGQQFPGFIPGTSADTGSGNASSFDPDFESFDYQNLLAGDRAFSGYVGELQDFSSLQQPQQLLRPQQLYAGVHRQDFSLQSSSSSSSQVGAPHFKKPHAAAPKAHSISTSSPTSPSEKSPATSQGYWPNQWDSRAFQRAGSSESFAPPALVSSPSSAESPRFSSAPVARRVSRSYPGSTVPRAGSGYDDRLVAHPSEQDQQDPSFLSPYPLQNQFFQQSSDPTLLGPVAPTPPSNQNPTFQGQHGMPPASPAQSHTSSVGPQRKNSAASSPYLRSQGQNSWAPYTTRSPRRSGSYPPQQNSSRGGSVDFEEKDRERSRCPDCGKPFRDLKAHMLTHQTERPEKCPITSCEYHKKGFSRKYDKNRHTLTHYKGTMVCGFCPHSGSAAEKSFNRADVFKRHLMTVHGVEQNPPNSRKKPSTASRPGYGSDATGKCSICQSVFANAQDFYEHLEDCVLDVVQKVDPSEAINEAALTSVAGDEDVLQTLERSNLPTSLDAAGAMTYGSGDDDDDEEDDDAEDDQPTSSKDPRSGRGGIKSKKDDPSSQLTHPRGVGPHAGGGAVTKPSTGGASGGRSTRGAGVTFSKGGVALLKQSRKRRKNYPVSWGCGAERMKMKKRVMTCWDGQRRLVKDDMMLGNDFEVRMALPGAGEGAYVTDLDVQTLRRADAFYSATEEERGPWEQFLTNVPSNADNNLMAS